VQEITGRNRDQVRKEIPKLRVPAKHERDECIYSDTERGDEGSGDGEARELSNNSATLG
jgi:hypothetical protein